MRAAWTTVGNVLADAAVAAAHEALRRVAVATGGAVRDCKLCGDELAIFPTPKGRLCITIETGNDHRADCDGLDLAARDPPYAKADASELRDAKPAATTPQQAPALALVLPLEAPRTQPAHSEPNTAPSDLGATTKESSE